MFVGDGGRKGMRSVIFDFDYTLADSSAGAVECVNSALRGLGLPTAPAEQIHRAIGLSLPETLVSLAGPERRGLSEAFARAFARRADEVMVDMTRIFEGVAASLTRLRSDGLRLGIVSTKFRRRIAAVLARERLLDRFDVIVGGEDVARHKPDPEGLRLAVERLGVAPGETLYVGDSVTDAETARRAGVSFLAVLSGVTRREEFKGYPVAGIIANVNVLADWLRA